MSPKPAPAGGRTVIGQGTRFVDGKPQGYNIYSDGSKDFAKGGAVKKGVPAHSGKPMIGRKTGGRKAGGLTAMPKGKC